MMEHNGKNIFAKQIQELFIGKRLKLVLFAGINTLIQFLFIYMLIKVSLHSSILKKVCSINFHNNEKCNSLVYVYVIKYITYVYY